MSLNVLIVDDEENARLNIGEFLSGKGYEAIGAATLAEAREKLNKGEGDIVLLDVVLPDGYGPSLLYETATMPSRPPIILITAYADVEMAVDAMKNGAHDFLTKPVQFNQLEKSLQRAGEIVRMKRELELFRAEQDKGIDFIVGESKEMKVILLQAQKAASVSVSVLITGETGTGKEVLAKFIHRSGTRANAPFVAINCAAIQSTMLESELFGHEAGAFTDANKKKHGLMEIADGGVLFLDEISSMALDTQAKILRAIEERAFRRVGGTVLVKTDVQILAASNRDLKAMMKSGEFREDLYYRLKVVDLHLLPLRERKEDIPALVGFFVRHFNMQMGMNVDEVTPRALQVLKDYSWHGNIRELKNIIERAMLFCDGRAIDLEHLPVDLTNTII